MILLNDFKRFDKYLDVTNMKQYLDLSYTLKFNGWFYEFESHFSSLYFKDNSLHFSYDDDVDITINPNIIAKISSPTLINSSSALKLYQRQFKLYKGKKLLISFKYTVEEFYKITTEEEDFDWGLLLSNIINVRERKKHIIESIKSNSIMN